METVTPSGADRRTGADSAPRTDLEKVQLGVILILVAIYFLQAATPLRLHPDAVVFLSTAESAEPGGGFLFHGQPTVFPPGYPALLALLIRLQMAHVWVIVSLSVLALVTGLVAVRYLVRAEGFGEDVALGVCTLSLLSFVFVKYSAIPLSDPLFFGLSMCCLAAMKQPRSSGFRLRRTLAAAVLLIASVGVRRVGVALIPAAVYLLVVEYGVRAHWMRLSVQMKGAAVLVGAAASALLGYVIYGTSTLRDFTGALKNGSLSEMAVRIVTHRLKELGEIALNVPAAAVPRNGQNILLMVGLLVFALVCGGVRLRRKQFGAVEVYFISYVAILFVWPFADPRFWLPVIPLLIAYAGLSLGRLARRAVAREILRSYVVLFAVMGLVALATSTALTFSGSRFPEAYAYEEFHSTYCAAWHCQGSFDATKVDQDGLHLLRRYK
ncbi:MAG TPA: hypothetical protein VN893_00290 [Bryobacteraceae bacterium]|nr:hypothetical protein [Bryobacteraceae bacterium]